MAALSRGCKPRIHKMLLPTVTKKINFIRGKKFQTMSAILPSIATDDRKQFQCLNINLIKKKKTGPGHSEYYDAS